MTKCVVYYRFNIKRHCETRRVEAISRLLEDCFAELAMALERN
jgi:hypothetical protein